MATRSSSRIKSKPKVDYSADTTSNEVIKKSKTNKNDSNDNSSTEVKRGTTKKVKVEPDVSPPAKGGRKRKAKLPIAVTEDKDMETKKTKIEEKIDTRIKEEKKGKIIVPVDSMCPYANGKSVYCDEDGPWDAMLNQTNVASNNNKYYLLQLLRDNRNNGKFAVWFRWGRIGYSNSHQNNYDTFNCLEKAMKAFKKKFSDKTKNSWPIQLEDFVKYSGKYDLIKLDYTVEETGTKDSTDVKVEPIESKLDHRLLSLMELISNKQAMEAAVMNMNYDVKKSPLGKLSKEQIRSGYEALTILEECIKAGKQNSARSKEACSMFYTRIPHSFGFRTPPLITTLAQVKLKMDLLDALIDIEAAVKAIDEGAKDTVHKTDTFYHNLKIEMKPLEKDSELFEMLSTYLHNTHGETHSHYSLEVEDIFELEKEGEADRYKDVGNKQLLWHGSRLTNWGGIFSQGLRIAPPEAPVTGYMFGKGVYFADMASKSANYCFTSRQQPTGILLLAEVSLGEPRELLSADYNASNLPSGKHSTKGMGKTCPDPAGTKHIGDVVVPMGVSSDSGIKSDGYMLQYNEYIVYDVKQIKMKYALRVKFNYSY